MTMVLLALGLTIAIKGLAFALAPLRLIVAWLITPCGRPSQPHDPRSQYLHCAAHHLN